LPAYLDAKATELLADGRETFRALGLEQESFVTEDRDLHVFLWRGSQATAVFGAALAMAGLAAEVHDFGVTLEKTGLNEILPILAKLGTMSSIDPSDMAAFVQNINAGKYRDFVPDGLARNQWVRQNALVVSRIPELARGVLPPNSTQEDE
jgi:ATP-dependent helicase Lhr and Lhr-like helicase